MPHSRWCTTAEYRFTEMFIGAPWRVRNDATGSRNEYAAPEHRLLASLTGPAAMKRDLAALSETTFDVLVIGGGIVGACTAWDAAQRGLRTALVERGDFACGASWNSLKTLHGGLRSLQHLDVARMREYSGDRSAWARIAPHLVDPLPVVMPTYGHGMRSRAVLRAALAVSDVVAFDRNHGLAPALRFPRGRVLTRAECVSYVPELADRRLTGGVLWHDAQMYSAERLVLEVVLAASEAGAVVANYVDVTGPLVHEAGGRIARVAAADRVGAGRLEIRARAIVNAAGSASTVLAERLLDRRTGARPRYVAAINVMLPSLGHAVAFALGARPRDAAREADTHGGRNLFIVPWRGRTVMGTGYFSYEGDPSSFAIDERHATAFLEEVNRAWPGAPIVRDAAVLVHGGLLPLSSGARADTLTLERRQGIIDHSANGAPALITAVSVRFTTARRLAERLVNLVARKLDRRVAACRTASTPLPGAPDVQVSELLAHARQRYGRLVDADVLEHLVRSYGARYERVLAYRDRTPDWCERVLPMAPVIRAQLAYGVREEMAQRPDDLLQRRTELGSRGMMVDPARVQTIWRALSPG